MQPFAGTSGEGRIHINTTPSWHMNDIFKLMDSQWFNQWYLTLIGAVLLASFGQLLLTRSRPDSLRVLRNNLLFGGLCLLMSLLVHPLNVLRMATTADLFNQVSILALGLLLIRICGLTAFRVLLPALKFYPPAILEDILLVLTYIAWGLVRLRAVGLDLSGIVTTSAIITGVIAFSMQETLGNILGGLALQLDDSFSIGDWIEVDNVRGQVVEVGWRHTEVRTLNGHSIVVPNSVLMKSKVDVYSHQESPKFRRWIKFRVNDGIPPQQVINIVTKALREAKIEFVDTNPAPECIVTDYHDGFIEYAVRYWLLDPRRDDGTDSVVRVHFYTALQRQNYSMARPQLDLRVLKESVREQQQMKLALRVQALKRVTLFANLSPIELEHLACSLHNTPFVKDDVMTKQGAVAHWLYLLVQGEADVWYEPPGPPPQERIHVATLKEGSIFGEMGLLTGEPRSATVIAKTDVECFRLDKEEFSHILQERPGLADEFARILSERSMELAILKKQPVPVQQEAHATYLDSIRRFFRLNGWG